MSNKQRPAEIKNQGDLLKLLANTPSEIEGFMALQAGLAHARREQKFPLGVDRAIRDHLVTVFKKDHIDIRAAALAKASAGAQGFQLPTDKPETPLSYKGLNTDFDRRIEARNTDGFVAEHTFLVTATVLVGFSRHAVREIVSQDPLRHSASTTTILEDTINILGEIKTKIPGYKAPIKRRKGIVMPGDTLNHNSSIDFLHEAIASSLKQSIDMLDLAERTIQAERKKHSTSTSTEIVRSHNNFQWVRDLIELILSTLASLRSNSLSKKPQPELPAPNTELTLPEPILTIFTVLDMMHTALSGLLVQLEANPSSFISEELEELSAIAATAQAAKKSNTTTQK